ncbi:hypothetical protein LSTR_LSTR004210 [Laodelphax striatellus]|uniref:EF-hand domain-containing protein n=1 Tax=Laodelphax striatellus TaxID=195883 RepID=A0A482X9R4_LAOST|nr:hypothetical protein LSTR_LSTR004210 [Laodelphax striatellus]
MAFNTLFRLCSRSSASCILKNASAGAVSACYMQLQDFSSMKAAQGYPASASASASSTNLRNKPHQQHVSDSDSDSDSEFDSQAKKDGVEFWRRKMRTFHGILDINKDGVIGYDDYQLLVNRFINLGHLSPQHAQEFRTLIQKMWEERWGSISEYNLITTEQYLEDMHHVISDKSLRKKMHFFLPYLFKAVDNDKDGSITIEEFKLFFQCLGLSSEDAVVSFNAIDENSDGNLSSEEFVKHGKEFFLSKDQKKPSKMFWGPLI